MEKVLQPYDKERMRMAMMKHEEIFKQQLCELHRLYRTQKMLMVSAGPNQQRQQPQQHQQQQIRELQERYMLESKNKTTFTINGHQQQEEEGIQGHIINGISKNSNNLVGLLQPIRRPNDHHQNHVGIRSDGQEHIAESFHNSVALELDESEIELTLSLGPVAASSKVQNPKGRRRPDKSESGQSVSSSSTGSSQTRKTSPKDSTSVITTVTRGDHHQFTWGSGTAFSTHPGSESEPGFVNGQQANPPWMFQTLSLKLT